MKYAIFDMDSTLFKTPGPEGHGDIYTKDEAQKWWTSPESLDLKSGIPGISKVHEKAIQAYKDPNIYTIMITHRQPKLKKQIIELLKHYGLGFNKIIITPSSNEKTDILLKKHPDFIKGEFAEVYEDSVFNLIKYKELFRKLNMPSLLHLITHRYIATMKTFEVESFEEFDYLYK